MSQSCCTSSQLVDSVRELSVNIDNARQRDAASVAPEARYYWFLAHHSRRITDKFVRVCFTTPWCRCLLAACPRRYSRTPRRRTWPRWPTRAPSAFQTAAAPCQPLGSVHCPCGSVSKLPGSCLLVTRCCSRLGHSACCNNIRGPFLLVTVCLLPAGLVFLAVRCAALVPTQLSTQCLHPWSVRRVHEGPAVSGN